MIQVLSMYSMWDHFSCIFCPQHTHVSLFISRWVNCKSGMPNVGTMKYGVRLLVCAAWLCRIRHLLFVSIPRFIMARYYTVMWCEMPYRSFFCQPASPFLLSPFWTTPMTCTFVKRISNCRDIYSTRYCSAYPNYWWACRVMSLGRIWCSVEVEVNECWWWAL